MISPVWRNLRVCQVCKAEKKIDLPQEEESSMKGMKLEKERRHKIRLLKYTRDRWLHAKSKFSDCILHVGKALKGFKQDKDMIWFWIYDICLADGSSCHEWCSLLCLVPWRISLTGSSVRVMHSTHSGFLDFFSMAFCLCLHKILNPTSANGYSYLVSPLVFPIFKL